MEYGSNLSWGLSRVTSLILEAERGGVVQAGEKKVLGRLNSRLPMRRLLRRCGQSFYSAVWQKDERQ